jgi:hypothetical protein
MAEYICKAWCDWRGTCMRPTCRRDAEHFSRRPLLWKGGVEERAVHSPRKVSDLTRCTSHNGHHLATRKEYDARCQAVMRFCAAARCTAARFTAQHRIAQHCTALHSAQHSTVQHTARHSTSRHCAARRVTPRLQTGRLRPPSKQRPLLLVLPSCCPSRGRCPFAG